MVMPSVACAVSTSGVCPDTVTLSWSPPTDIFTSTRDVSPTDTGMFGRTTGLNPPSVAFTV